MHRRVEGTWPLGSSGFASAASTPGRTTRSRTSRGVRVGHTTLIEGDGPLVVGRGPGPHRRHRDPRRTSDDVWAEPVFAGCHRLNGNGELTGLEWIREAGLLGRAGRDHQHPQRRRRPRRAGRPRHRPSTRRRRPVVAAGRRGDVGRAAQRHRRPPRPARARRRRDRQRAAAARSRRATSAAGPAWSATSSRAASGRRRASSTRGRRRLDRRRAGPGQLRRARPAARRRRPGGPRDPGPDVPSPYAWPRRPTTCVPPRRAAVGPTRAGHGLDHHHRRDRRPAPAPPVRAARPARDARPGADGQHREPLVGRHRPRVRDRQPRPRRRPTSPASRGARDPRRPDGPRQPDDAAVQGDRRGDRGRRS